MMRSRIEALPVAEEARLDAACFGTNDRESAGHVRYGKVRFRNVRCRVPPPRIAGFKEARVMVFLSRVLKKPSQSLRYALVLVTLG